MWVRIQGSRPESAPSSSLTAVRGWRAKYPRRMRAAGRSAPATGVRSEGCICAADAGTRSIAAQCSRRCIGRRVDTSRNAFLWERHLLCKNRHRQQGAPRRKVERDAVERVKVRASSASATMSLFRSSRGARAAAMLGWRTSSVVQRLQLTEWRSSMSSKDGPIARRVGRTSAVPCRWDWQRRGSQKRVVCPKRTSSDWLLPTSWRMNSVSKASTPTPRQCSARCLRFSRT